MKFQQHEFRVSSFVSLRRDFSIFRSFSLSRSSTAFSPQLLHLSFLFPSVTSSTPPLLHSLFPFSPRHSPPLLPSPPLLGSSRCFPSLSLSLSILALSRVGHGQRSASQPGGEVWQRRESGCASGAWWGLWENSHAGDCVPAASGAHHHRRYGESCSTSCFHAPRAFHRARKKRGEEQGEGEKGISLGASRENSIR